MHSALGRVLRAEVEPAALASEIARDGYRSPGRGGRVAGWLAAVAAAVVAALAWRRGRSKDASFGSALDLEAATLAPTLAPLLLRPALTLLALASVAAEPSYPYAFTLPVARRPGDHRRRG